MKKALINPIDLIEGYPSVGSVNDTEFPCTPAYYWVDCPDDTQTGMYYKDNNFYVYTPPPQPEPPSPPPTLEENKLRALSRLQRTDWVEIPSVTDVNNTPYLVNYSDFIAFRLEARSRVVNPQAGVLTWMKKPMEQWSA
jgi:hypothetical protein